MALLSESLKTTQLSVYPRGAMWYHSSGNDLLSDVIKPLPQPVLIYRQRNPLAISWTHFHSRSFNEMIVSNHNPKSLPERLMYRQVSNIIRQLNCWSLRCSWSIACRRCSNYIFIINLTPGFNGLGKDNYKMRWEAFKFWDLVRLILETLRY